MKVAVASYRSREEIYLGHFGDAEVYRIYKYDEQSGFKLIELRDNPFRGEHVLNDEDEKGKRPRVLRLVGDADILVAAAFGRGGKEFMEKHGKHVVLVPPKTRLKDILRIIAENLEHKNWLLA